MKAVMDIEAAAIITTAEITMGSTRTVRLLFVHLQPGLVVTDQLPTVPGLFELPIINSVCLIGNHYSLLFNWR